MLGSNANSGGTSSEGPELSLCCPQIGPRPGESDERQVGPSSNLIRSRMRRRKKFGDQQGNKGKQDWGCGRDVEEQWS